MQISVNFCLMLVHGQLSHFKGLTASQASQEMVTDPSSATILALLFVVCSATIDFDVEGALNTIDQVGTVPGRSILNVDDSRGLLVDLLSKLCLSQAGLCASRLDRLSAHV